MNLSEKHEKIKSLQISNFVFWVLGKFLMGLGIGILLPVYIRLQGWEIVGIMLVIFSLILMAPACSKVLVKKKKK